MTRGKMSDVRGGWGADAALRACRKMVCRPRGTDQRRGRVVLVNEHRTTRVSSARRTFSPGGPPQAPTGPTLEQGKLPAKGKVYPSLGFKRVRDKPPKAQQQPAVAQ
ncbi:hypothetical protein QJQ45_028775 [Haematococcus lacustris]|nr:hypothetical protein QJQ45_028775 [Haematococcus lacustris]